MPRLRSAELTDVFIEWHSTVAAAGGPGVKNLLLRYASSTFGLATLILDCRAASTWVKLDPQSIIVGCMCNVAGL